MRKKGTQQSNRLTTQQKEHEGAIGIFDEQAHFHDHAFHSISEDVLNRLQHDYPKLNFRYRNSVSKKEINDYLQK